MSVEIAFIDQLKEHSDNFYEKLYELIRESGLDLEYQQSLFKAVGDYLNAEVALEKIFH